MWRLSGARSTDSEEKKIGRCCDSGRCRALHVMGHTSPYAWTLLRIYFSQVGISGVSLARTVNSHMRVVTFVAGIPPCVLCLPVALLILAD